MSAKCLWKILGENFAIKQCGIRVSKPQEAVSFPRIDTSILTELCHYHLYDQGKGYRHKDPAFKQLLQQVDGLRFTPPLPENTGRVKRIYFYQCPHCGQEYRRKRKIDLKKYACGHCRSRLQFLEMRQEWESVFRRISFKLHFAKIGLTRKRNI